MPCPSSWNPSVPPLYSIDRTVQQQLESSSFIDGASSLPINETVTPHTCILSIVSDVVVVCIGGCGAMLQ
jgi:hypothetical protein